MNELDHSEIQKCTSVVKSVTKLFCILQVRDVKSAEESGRCGKRTVNETLFSIYSRMLYGSREHVMHPAFVNSVLLYKMEEFVSIHSP